jgi:hypothetical protein
MPPGVAGSGDSGSGARRVHSTKPSGRHAERERVAAAPEPALRKGAGQQRRRGGEADQARTGPAHETAAVDGRSTKRRHTGGHGSPSLTEDIGVEDQSKY